MARCAHPARANRVEVNIAADFEQISITINQYALEPPLKQVAHLVVPPVIGLRIDAIDLAHQARKIGATRVNHEMIMIVHQAIGERDSIEAPQCLRNKREKRGQVLTIANPSSNLHSWHGLYASNSPAQSIT